MTGDDRLRSALHSLEESAPTDFPPRRAGSGPRRWFPVAMSAALVAVTGLMVGVAVPSLLDAFRPAASTSPVSSADPTPGRDTWEWTRHELPGQRAWVWDMIDTGEGLVAVGTADGVPAGWYSGDGTTWERASVENVVIGSDYYGEMAATRLAQVYEQDGLLLAIGLPQLGTPMGFKSTDGGRTWLENERFEWREDPERWSGGSAIVVDVINTPSGWIAAGNRAVPGWAMYIRWDVVWDSPDGHVWEVVDERDSLLGRRVERGAELGALTVDDGTVYAVGRTVWTSEDGSRWQEDEPSIPRLRGTLDGVIDLDGLLIASESGGEGPESFGGRIWARPGEAWQTEMSLEPPGSIETIAEYSFGVLATGMRDGLPTAWHRNEAGEWWVVPAFETERAWVGPALEYRGRLLISGSLTELDEEGTDVSRQAVVWIGNPPSPSTATPGPQGEMVPVPTSPPNPSGLCHQALLEGTLVRDPETGFAVEHDGEWRTGIRWPNGFVAREGPDGLELLDADGRVVAREGDAVRLGGGGDGDTFWTCSSPEVVPTTLTGTLMGDPNYEGGCVWVSKPDGQRWAIQWPEPYRLELSGEDAVLYNGDEVVGREGDQVTLRGTLGDDFSYCGVSYDALEVIEVRATP